MIKAVFDTNVFISALCAPKGVCAGVFTNYNRNRYELVISETILCELLYVGLRKYFRKYFEVYSLYEFIEKIKVGSILIENQSITKVDRALTNDIKDLPILNTFLSSNADYLVTGNKKHFCINPSKLLSPHGFLHMILK